MKKGIKFGLVIALLLMAMSIFAHAYDCSETITDGVEFMSPNEALSYMAFMYNVSEITSFSPEDTVIYAYLTGQLEKGTDEYYEAQLVYLFTMYGAVNTNHNIANAKLEASRVSLEKYLTGKMGSNPDVAGVQEYVNGKLGGIKSTLKKIVVDLCGEGMEIAFATNNAFLNVLSAKDKAAAFIADMTAVLDAVKFINNRNMTMCYSYYTAYLYYRNWYDSGSTGPQIFGSLMEEFLLRNIGDLDGINIIFEKLGMHTWTDRDVQVLLGRFAEFAYHTEIEVNSYVDEIESIEVRSLPRTVYYLNQKLDLSGFSLLVTRKSGQTEIVSGFSLDKTFTQAGEYEITVPYGGTNFIILVDVYYDGGKCGQVLEWFLDYKYTLHIEGKGAMTDYEQGTAPWYSYRSKIKQVSLPDGMTAIGDNAFCNCKMTGPLVIPDGVTAIGTGAFFNCEGFTGDLVIPDSVITIGSVAFSDCYGFTGDLVIGDSVTTIGGGAFLNCMGFTGDLVIGDSVTTIGSAAFASLSCTGDLVIPDSVATIGEYAFSGCSGFTGSLVIPDSVTTICENAFDHCRGLTGNLVIPDSVTTIGNGAFSDCSGLTGNLVIPDSVTTIGNGAFAYCNGLTGTLSIPFGVTRICNNAFFGCSGLTGVVIPVGVTSIFDGSFEGCRGLKSVVLPNSLRAIYPEAFIGCTALTDVY